MSDFYVTEATKEAPFYYDGITLNEYMTELCYYMINFDLVKQGKYKTLKQQLADGDISEIPEKYKALCV
mgnify:FL=1